MPKTSIYIDLNDKDFCLSVGKNLSDGIRKCISYKRETEKFKKDLELILQTNTFTNTNIPEVCVNEVKGKLLKLMDM